MLIVIAVSGIGHARKQATSLDAVIRMQESPPQKRFLVGCSSPLMRLAQTPHGASHVVQAVSAWSVKTRRVPSRHCRDATVYGRVTTTMHHMITPPPPYSLSSLRNFNSTPALVALTLPYPSHTASTSVRIPLINGMFALAGDSCMCDHK